jgi:hypothetical protein
MAATWLPLGGSEGDLVDRILGTRPELYSAYAEFRDVVVRESGLDVRLVSRCGERVRWLLTACGDEPVAAGDVERAVFRYVDSFVRDVHAVADADVEDLRRWLSVRQVVGLTELLALLDGFGRFRLILGDGGT